jgi:hypothetical protein
MPLSADIFFHVMKNASIKTIELEPRLIIIIEGEDWRAPIMAYLHHFYEPNNTIVLAYQNAVERPSLPDNR